MKKIFSILLFLFFFSIISAQEKKPIPSGIITITTKQKIKFKNPRFEDNQVVFFNTETNSEFTYFMNSIRTISDADGNIVYAKKEEVLPPLQPKPKLSWIKESDSLRDKKQLRAEIIFKNGDTLKTHIKVVSNLFSPTLLDPLSVTKKIITIKDKVKTKYSAEDIKSMRFIDLDYKERIFVANNKELVELLFDGKIRWCRMYYSTQPGDVSATDFMINRATNEFVGIGLFNSRRNKLKEITKERPDLIPMIDEMKTDDKSILALLKKYEE